MEQFWFKVFISSRHCAVCERQRVVQVVASGVQEPSLAAPTLLGAPAGGFTVPSVTQDTFSSTASADLDSGKNSSFQYRLPAGLSLLGPIQSGLLTEPGGDSSARIGGSRGGPSGGLAGGQSRGVKGNGSRGYQPDSAVSRLVRAALAEHAAGSGREAGGSSGPPGGASTHVVKDGSAGSGMDGGDGQQLPPSPPLPAGGGAF